ncbi:MAG TPA: hypothetical protein VF058_00050 [Actinomycetota bacterium]
MKVRDVVATAVATILVLGLAGPASAAKPKTRLISRATSGTPGDNDSYNPVLSASGRYIAFESYASNLPGGNGSNEQVYVHDRVTKKTRLVSKFAGQPGTGDSYDPSISGDGRYVSFTSTASNFPGGDGATEQIYVHDRVTKKTRLVSKTPGGAPGGGHSSDSAISGNGRVVVFETEAPNLGGSGADEQLRVYNLRKKKGRLLSKTKAGVPGDGTSNDPAISHSGRYVVFETDAPNLGANNSPDDQIALWDRKTGRIRIVSRSSSGAKADGDSDDPNISANGRWVTFSADSTNLGPADGTYDQAYLRDLAKRKTRLVSKSSGGAIGDDDSGDGAVSDDGRFIVFETFAPNLGANGDFQILLRDMKKNMTKLMSRDAAGAPGSWAFMSRGQRTITPDGRFVSFDARGTNLPGGAGGFNQTYIRGPLI